MVVDFLFQGAGIKRPAYLEIGVYRPKHGSNTYKFYDKGARGVLVEVDYTLIEEIKNARPEDKILNIGVGPEEVKEADLFVFEEPSLNTLSKEEANYRVLNGSYKIKEVIKVELKSINKIIEENFQSYPDFLSLDIEGFDLEVLKTLDYRRFPIPVICAETCEYSVNHVKNKDWKIISFMESIGYFSYADTYINTIFVNHNWFYSME